MSSAILPSCMAARSEAAAPVYCYFEIMASGKGVGAETDSNPPPEPVYSEFTDSFSKVLLYARYERISRLLTLAYYNQASTTWATTPNIPAYETKKNVLAPFFPLAFPIHVDSISSNLFATGNIQIQIKEKNGIITNSRLKSLGMSYYQTYPHILAGETQLMGVLTLKGKQIGAADVPTDVMDAFF